MGARRIAVIALTGVLVAGGTGAAIAAVTRDDGKKTEQAVLDNAAKRLNVTPEKLREALAAAQDEQIDQAVKDGKLTQKQADAIKAARKQSGRVLGPLGGGPGKRFGPGPWGPGPGGGPGAHKFGFALGFGGGLIDELADALGTTPAKLVAQLRDGKSIADVAKANGKSLDDVRSALKAAAKTRLDKAVASGDLTQKQADAILARVDEHLEDLASGRLLRPGGHRHRGDKPSASTTRPGALMPGDEVPAPAPPAGVYY